MSRRNYGTTLLMALAYVFGFATISLAGPAFTRPLRVVDSAGKVVGSLVGGDDPGHSYVTATNVVRREGRIVVGFAVGQHSIGPGCQIAGGLFLHEAPDCSGTRYVKKFGLVRGTLAVVVGPVVYYPGDRDADCSVV